MAGYSYAQAETVLAAAYAVTAESVQRGAFRGRLKHLKRLGIPLDSTPGRGKRVQYEDDHLFQWAFCLELEEFGLDPVLIAHFVRAYWPMVSGYFQDATNIPEDGDLFFKLSPRVMSRAWSKPAGAFQRQFPEFADHSVFRSTDKTDLAWHLRGEARRACFINLSEVVRALDVQKALLLQRQGAE